MWTLGQKRSTQRHGKKNYIETPDSLIHDLKRTVSMAISTAWLSSFVVGHLKKCLRARPYCWHRRKNFPAMR